MGAEKAGDSVEEESSRMQQDTASRPGVGQDAPNCETQRLITDIEQSDNQGTCVFSVEEEETCLTGWPGFSLMGKVCSATVPSACNTTAALWVLHPSFLVSM